MSAVGVGLLWWGYWWGLGGLSLVKGWNNNVLQMANPLKVPEFTRQCYVGPGLWPTGKSSDSGSCGGRGTGGGGTGAKPRNKAVRDTGAGANSVGAAGGGFGR